MSTLNTSKLTFFSNGGEPLKSGYIYVGETNLDPQVTDNQKEVTFRDSQGNEFAATQPLRTNTDGRIQYNGKAITATVDGDYSLLILDSNQVEINGGWTPYVEASSSSTSSDSNYRNYALTLSEVKQINVSVGETVGSIGADSASDGGGVDWLVISNSGESEDDIDLIDFDNGLQGRRIIPGPNYIDDDNSFIKIPQYYLATDANEDIITIDEEDYSDSEVFSVGPTGSGADVEWSPIDNVSLQAQFIDVYLTLRATSSTDDLSSIDSTFYAGKSSDDTRPVLTSLYGLNVDYISSNRLGSVVRVPVDDGNIFYAKVDIAFADGFFLSFFRITGFGA